MATKVETGRLKSNEIGLWHGIFQSFSHVAPGAEVAILVTGTAIVALGSTPLVFVLSGLIVLVWLNTNYQFSKTVATSGGYSEFARRGLGHGAGNITGWLFFFNEFLTYTGFALLSFSAFIYLLSPTITNTPYLWIPLMIPPLLFTTFFVYRGVKFSLDYAAITGIIETAFLVIGAIVIILKVGAGNTLSVFTPAPVGNNLSVVGLGLLFGLYSFGGSGSVIALGEETKNPLKVIKKAILYGWVLIMIPLVLNAYALTVGWGLPKISTFGTSPDPGVIEYFRYLGIAGGVVFVVIIINSFLDFGIAINNSLTRMLYYLSRETKMLPSYMSQTHPKYGTPHKAIITVAFASFITAILSGLAFGPFVGALVIEGAASIAFMLQHFIATTSLPIYSRKIGNFKLFYMLVLPLIAIIFIAFAIFSTVYPVPSYPYNLPAYIIIAWTAIGGVVLYLVTKRKNRSVQAV